MTSNNIGADNGHRTPDQTTSGGSADGTNPGDDGTNSTAAAYARALARKRACQNAVAKLDQHWKSVFPIRADKPKKDDVRKVMPHTVGPLFYSGAGGGVTWVSVSSSSTNSLSRSAAGPEPEPIIENCGIRLGEIIGWRAWRVIDGKLVSFVMSYPWFPGEPMVGDVNATAWGSFRTGVYALRSAETARRMIMEHVSACIYIGGDLSVVLGRVSLWGEVVEHQGGYRAEFAKPHSLDEMTHGYCDLPALRKLYGLAP